jgi:glycosyltransferase involved in cell wall biosynthesis
VSTESMPRCLVVSPFPTMVSHHGRQKRVDSIVQCLRRTGWNVVTAGIYPVDMVDAEARGPDDILVDRNVSTPARENVVLSDFLIARQAARDPDVSGRVRELLRRVAPDIVHVEYPWDWLLLRETLPSGGGPRVVYSSPATDWDVGPHLFGRRPKRPDADELVEEIRQLETEVARAADLVVTPSDLQAAELERIVGQPVLYAPPASTLADLKSLPVANHFGATAAEAGVRAYAALMGSEEWPNIEGFFDAFPEGLGFLQLDQQFWVAGTVGSALEHDPRYQDFWSINASRTRILGFLPEEHKAEFFGAAACVVIPVRRGAGVKLKTADAIASGRPVITTLDALEGYGPIVQSALGEGIYVADTPSEFRRLIRQAMRGDATGCTTDIRRRLSPRQLAHTLDSAYRGLLARDTHKTPRGAYA